ncbi:MAG: starch synthase [Paraburkholderia sp.]|jgi:starch synthase|nr:starch synthase [Paraburkholderia sp.]
MSVRVLHVGAELYPLLKTGGLADVLGALPQAQIELGTDARVLLPGFPSVIAGLEGLREVARIAPVFGVDNATIEFGILRGGVNADEAGLGIYVIRADVFYQRAGSPYVDVTNRPYDDNIWRFALLGWTAAQLAQSADASWRPDIVHAHDWHAALAPAYLRAAGEMKGAPIVPCIMTVHNLAYQGLFPAVQWNGLRLPDHYFDIEGLEFYGQISFLKAGLHYADRITTVSPNYAREVQTAEHGAGLHGLLKRRTQELSGILNGVDYTVWNPLNDSSIVATYGATRLREKAKNKGALQKRLGLKVDSETLLFGVVSRLTQQKGFDLLLEAVPEIVKRGGQLAVLGTGEPPLEAGLRRAVHAHPEAVGVHLGFDEALAHLVTAGSDVIMVPSRFEPCGLTQLYALAYGSLPLVHRVGGLADTVFDASLENLADGFATGFVFERFEHQALVAAIRRAFALHARPFDWRRTQQCAMQQNFSWESAAQRYLELYQLLQKP